MTLLDNAWIYWDREVCPTNEIIPYEIESRSPLHFLDFRLGTGGFHEKMGEVNDLNLMEFGGR